jgi:hypothetical protein
MIAMRFFTPELFVALNSQQEDVVDEAMEKWDAARNGYRKHFARLEMKLPRSFVQLCRTVPLHDSQIERLGDPVWTIVQTDDEGQQSRAIISVRREHTEFDLVYLDIVRPTEWSKPVESHVFSDEHVLWLYDEVGRTKNGAFTHEILFSNGTVVLLTFRGFKFVERPIIADLSLSRAAV